MSDDNSLKNESSEVNQCKQKLFIWNKQKKNWCLVRLMKTARAKTPFIKILIFSSKFTLLWQKGSSLVLNLYHIGDCISILSAKIHLYFILELQNLRVWDKLNNHIDTILFIFWMRKVKLRRGEMTGPWPHTSLFFCYKLVQYTLPSSIWK